MLYRLRYFLLFALVLAVLGAALLLGRVDGDWFAGTLASLWGLFVGAGAWQASRGGK